MKRALFALTFLAAALCATGASAQQFTKDGKRIGTRDELRACYDTRDAIDARQKDLIERRNKLSAEVQELNTEGEDLRQQLKQADVDNLSGLRRTRLERRVKDHDARLKEAQEKSAALDQETQGLVKQAEDQKKNCTNVAFENDDVAAVKKEREAAGKK